MCERAGNICLEQLLVWPAVLLYNIYFQFLLGFLLTLPRQTSPVVPLRGLFVHMCGWIGNILFSAITGLVHGAFTERKENTYRQIICILIYWCLLRRINMVMKLGEVYPSNNWGDMEVIGYETSRKVRVRFIDTGFEKMTHAHKIRNGNVAGRCTRPRAAPGVVVQVGGAYPSKNYGIMEVIEHISSIKVLVRFRDTGYTKYAEACNIRRGEVKDLLSPSVCGVGYVGVGNYNSYHKSNGVWSDMLRRCYNSDHQTTQPTYKGCTVAKEWHNFQVFAKWFDEHSIAGYELDKDIKVKGNKVYGPDTCTFVTSAENVIEARAKAYSLVFGGTVTQVYNLSEFCRDNKLKYSRVYPVAASGSLVDVSKYII